MDPVFALLWSDAERACEVAAGLDAAAWQALDRQARQHRLRPLLHARAAAGAWPVPNEVAENWQASHWRSAQRALRQKVALARIGRGFAASGVTAAVLKGGAFVWSGGINPAVRPMRDIDILVRPDQAVAAAVVVRALGFSQNAIARPSRKHLPGLTDGRVTIEVHLRIVDTYDTETARREEAFIARAWQRTVAGDVAGMQALCPTDTLLHLILHAVFDHQFNNGPLLLVDLSALVGSGTIDWPMFWDEAAALGVIRACQLALALGERVCGLAVDWQRHAPHDLGEDALDRALRLMLVDMDYRSAIGWPGQLLRAAPHRWPAELSTMMRRRNAGATGTGSAVTRDAPGLGAAFAYAVGSEGRARIADAVRLSLWLRRG